MSNKKSEMIKQQVSANQGQASDNKSGHPVPGKGGKKPGHPKPKNMEDNKNINELCWKI